MRKTLTISVPTEDIPMIEEIQGFCKKHRQNLSGIVLAKLLDWYEENKASIQKMFYKQNGKILT